MRAGARRALVWAGSALLVLVLAVTILGVLFWRSPLWFADRVVRLQLWREGTKSRTVEVDGYRLHTFELSAKVPGGGTPVVLLHGLGSRGEDWAPLMPRLAAAGFHVYVPDLLGYGRSATPDVSYSIALEEKLMADYMRAEGLTHANVAGWSMGGWVALRLAADHPEMVDKLLLYDSAGVSFDLRGADSLFLPHTERGVRALFARLSPRPPELPEYVERDLLRRLQAGEWVRARSLDAMMTGHDLMDFRLGAVRAPTLVVWGAKDRLIPISAGMRIAAGIAGARLVPVPGCGHLAPGECAAKVAVPTIAFLRGEMQPVEPVQPEAVAPATGTGAEVREETPDTAPAPVLPGAAAPPVVAEPPRDGASR